MRSRERSLEYWGVIGGVVLAIMLLAGCMQSSSRTYSRRYVRPSARAPIAKGLPYTIRSGDTFYSIARRFDRDWRDLLVANPKLDPHNLRPGGVIIIPGEAKVPKVAEILKPVPDPVPWPFPQGKAPRYETPKSAGHPGPIPAERHFVWPMRGRILARYGMAVSWRRGEVNRGIDIRGKAGQLVVAAKSGRINTFANVAGYGRAVLLEHSDGTSTFYGYLDEILVPHGRWIKQGESLASAGRSAYSRGTELHFRVMRGEKFINPLSVLSR